jgi:hypothetical protein
MAQLRSRDCEEPSTRGGDSRLALTNGWRIQVARAMLLEEPNTVGSVESYVMQVLVQLDLDGCILVRLCR